jgi:C4-type Zn-finger protein
VNSVSFSSDGKYVALGSDDKTVKIWTKSINNNWYSDKIFSASESPFRAQDTIVKQTIISAQNQELFKQRVDNDPEKVQEKVTENIIDDTHGELSHSFTFALETAKLSELILKNQITKYDVLKTTRVFQLDLTMLLTKSDPNQNNNRASVQEEVKQITVDQMNSNLSAENSGIPRIKPDNRSKAQTSSLNGLITNVNEQQQLLKNSQQFGSQKEDKKKTTKDAAISNKAKSACCNLFMIIEQKYDNPLLNYPQVFMEISRRLGMEKTLQASDSLNKEGYSSLLDEVLQEISQEKETRNYQKGLDLLRDLLLDVTRSQKNQIYIYINKHS